MVFKFYKYWDYFDSWRDFSQFDEYDVREAQDRYERRYMEKENKKIKDKYAKKERARIIKLVETAYKFDPRIKAHLEKEEAEKLRKKEEERQMKEKVRLDLEEKIRQQEAIKQQEVDRKNEEVRKVKEERDALIRRRKENVRLLGSTCEERLPGSNFDRFFAEEFCKKLKTPEALEEFMDKFKETAENCKTEAEFREALEEMVGRVTGQNQKQQVQAKSKEEEKKQVDNWTIEELSALSKAIIKYPGAMLDRWKFITEHVGTKTQKQVIAKSQELAKRTSSGAVNLVQSSTFGQIQKKKQDQPIPAAKPKIVEDQKQ